MSRKESQPKTIARAYTIPAVTKCSRNRRQKTFCSFDGCADRVVARARELCTYAFNRDQWRARVRALKQPQITSILYTLRVTHRAGRLGAGYPSQSDHEGYPWWHKAGREVDSDDLLGRRCAQLQHHEHHAHNEPALKVESALIIISGCAQSTDTRTCWPASIKNSSLLLLPADRSSFPHIVTTVFQNISLNWTYISFRVAGEISLLIIGINWVNRNLRRNVFFMFIM